MPKHRTIRVIESEVRLRAILRTAVDDRMRARIGVLLTIMQEPNTTLADIAQKAAVPLRTMHRWMAVYQHGGIESLLDIGHAGFRITIEVEQLIRRKLMSHYKASASSIRRWLSTKHDVNVSLPTVIAAMNRISIAPLQFLDAPDHATISLNESQRIANWIRKLFEATPFRIDARTWIELFKESLFDIANIDHVSVDVNLNALQPSVESQARSLGITHHVDAGATRSETVYVDIRAEPLCHSRRLLDEMTEGGFPRHEFHDPEIEEYFESDDTYLGTIMLWRQRGRPPFARAETSMLRSARPLIMRLFVDCAARHQCQHPVNRLFYASLEQISIDARLTKTQQRVLTLRMLGSTSIEIAESLGIEEDTVNKHLSAVYRKSKSQGFAELYAKHFTPRLR